MTTLAGDRTADTSGQVINLNTNTAFKYVPHMLGYLQFLQTVAELCADAHYYFAHSLNSPGEAEIPVCVWYDAYLHPEPPGQDCFIVLLL